MTSRRTCRPSLKITRYADADVEGYFCCEVWIPFVGVYQRVDSVEDGETRVGELAHLIYRMRLRRHPKQDALIDVPETAVVEGGSWAEFRVNASTLRTYDTRSDDRPEWVRATGMMQASAAIRNKVGCLSRVDVSTKVGRAGP
jgi:hypothetical protein